MTLLHTITGLAGAFSAQHTERPHTGRSYIKDSVIPFFRGRLPGQLIIQLTDRCNATCPQCGMRKGARFQRSTLAVDDVKRALDHAAANGFRVVSFTGGEPFLHEDELFELILHASHAGLDYVRTGTNGYMFARSERAGWEKSVRRLAERLARTDLRNFWISMDSADPGVHESMRGLPGVVRGIERALPWFHEVGIYPSINLGMNRNTGGEPLGRLATAGREGTGRERFRWEAQRAFDRFFTRAVDLGFTLSNICYPMSMDAGAVENGEAVYAATSTDDLVRFTRQEKALLYDALIDSVSTWRSRIRIFTPISSLRGLQRHHAQGIRTRFPCRGGADFFFIDSKDCNTYPCGFRGRENLGKFWHLDLTNPPIEANCTACDWECFRDPSEAFGNLLDVLQHPVLHAVDRLWDRKEGADCIGDMAYAMACGAYDGRLAPDYARMAGTDMTDPSTHVHMTPRTVS